MKVESMARRYKLLLATCMVLAGSVVFASSDVTDQEVDRYLTQYRAVPDHIKQLVEQLKWSGIGDPRLFDPIASDLQQLVEKGDLDAAEVEQGAWLVHALAYSGQERYRPLLERIENAYRKKMEHKDKKLHRNVSTALTSLENHQKWNLVIGRGTEQASSVDELRRLRVKNMLSAEEPVLVRVGANLMIHDFLRDREVTDLARDRLLELHVEAEASRDHADAVAWLCKALGATRNEAYAPALKKVQRGATVRTVERWSAIGLRQVGG